MVELVQRDRRLTIVQHILTRKHRKFAENEKNWEQLDDLLSQLKRRPKYQLDDHEDYEEEL